MLSFFRRAFNSKVVLGILAVIAIAIVVTGVGTPSGLGFGGGGAAGETVAKVGGQAIGAPEVARRAENVLAGARRQSPGATMTALVQQGGVEAIVDQLAAARALELWARRHGIAASDRLIDGDIASVPAFAGPTGKFDEDTYRRTLAQARISEAEMRADVRSDVVRRLLLGPVSGGAQASRGLVLPYASLLLERREGFAALVPVTPAAGPAPTEAEVGAWYSGHLAAYSLPERRVVRTALMSPEQAKVTPPTDAEIAADYTAHAADYAATESRTLSQLVLPSEAAARAASAKIKGGASFATVAQGAGFSASDTAIGTLSRTELTSRSGSAAATAVFALPDGGVSDPVRASIGWAILRVDGIKRSAARPLAAVTGEIAARLLAARRERAYADLVAAVEDAVDGGSTFDEVAKAKGLSVSQTPPVTAQGAAPGVAGWSAPAALAAILKPAFDADPDDEPTVETLPGGQGAVLVKVAQVLPAAPRPLGEVHADVTRDLLTDRANRAAQALAQAIAAKASRGVPLAQAVAAAGARLPAPQPIAARQADLARGDTPAPPALLMLFGLKRGAARAAPTPDGKGWLVVQFTASERGDAATQPQLVQLTQREFARILGDEYAQEFAHAVEREVGSTRDAAAVARLKTALSTNQAVQ